MNKYYIEEIIKYNRKISIFNLVYRKIKFEWWQPAIGSVIIISIIFCCNFSYKEDYLFFYLSFLAFVASFIVTILILRNRIKNVIRIHYQYALNENGNLNNKSFLEIQKVELVNLLGADLIKKESLLFLIDKLTASNERNKYFYNLTTNVILITIGVYSGAFLPKFLDFATDMKDYELGTRLLTPVIILCAFFFIIIEISIIKDVILRYRNGKNRIVRTLENIYLDKYIE